MNIKKYLPSPITINNYLIGAFLFLVLIKSVLFVSSTPYIWADEYVWYSVSNSLFQSGFTDILKSSTYPIGYPLVLSIAHFISDNKETAYQIMIIINCILTSSILFPSYYILNKYITNVLHAYLGSILIAVLPVSILFSSNLMTENLFIPLTVFSVWFLHESFIRNQISWDIIAGISVFYLYLTRDTSGVFCIIAFISAHTFFFITLKKEEKFTHIKKKVLLICIIIIPILIWMVNKIFLSTKKSYINPEVYFPILFSFFSDINSLLTFLIHFFSHIEYLALHVYVIFFILFVVLTYTCMVKSDCFGISMTLNQSFSDKVRALHSTLIYCLVFGAGLLVMNSLSIIHLRTDPTWGHFYESLFFLGRYLYPIVPAIVIFGLIGWELLSQIHNETKPKTEILCLFGLPIILLAPFILQYIQQPHITNNYAIIYLSELFTKVHPILSILLLFIGFFFIPYYLIKNQERKDFKFIFLTYFIIISIIASIPLYVFHERGIKGEADANQIGKYFAEFNSSDSKVLFDIDDYYQEGWLLYNNIKFWTTGNIECGKVTDDSTIDMNNSDYIVSSQWLPLSVIREAHREQLYRLYDAHKRIDPYIWGNEILFGIGGTASQYTGEGWSRPENGFTWTDKIQSSVVILVNDIPKKIFLILECRPFIGSNLKHQIVIISINGKKISKPIIMKNTTTDTMSNLILPVPPEYLKKGANYITLTLPNATSPMALGISQDPRMLGIAVKTMILSTNFPNEYHIGDTINFSKGGNSKLFQQTGWSPQEEGFTWTDGNEATLILNIEKIFEHLIFTLKGIPLIGSDLKHQTVIISINNKAISNPKMMDNTMDNLSVPIPSDYLISGENHISLTLPNATSPMELGINQDPRMLGLAVMEITISKDSKE